MKIPFLDLAAQYASIQDEIESAVLAVLRSQQYILGEQVAECERRLAAYSHCAHGVGVSSGSDALLACLMAEGIGPGDEVITTPYTFFATAGCISRVGARPVFVDICPATYLIDPGRIEARITPRTRAVIPVHLFGRMAEMDAILAIAQEHELAVVEDAAQAVGAEYQGRRAGSLGHYGCFSFFPAKNLGCAGDGGMVVTQDAERAERLRVLRSHGSNPKYFHAQVGGNFRLDAIQAAIVTVKLDRLEAWTAARSRHAERYTRWFHEAGLVARGLVVPPDSPGDGDRHVYNQYVIRLERRDEFRGFLQQHGIPTQVYYPLSLHEQACFANLGYRRGDFPQAELAAQQSVALPISPNLTAPQQSKILKAISAFFEI